MAAGRTKTTSIELSAANIGSFRRFLLAWFRESRRDLPWRRTVDPYVIWLSEIMLQQTRVEAVIPYFERFLAAFPTIERLAKSPLERVLRMWAGLGYYSRARNLHATARAVVRDFAGNFPASSNSLQTLPGVGRYTAAAIASIAFGESAAVLDGNVKRVIARLLAICDSIEQPAIIARLWTEAGRLLDPRHPGDFNQAMMELGATVCTPRNPRCHYCPVSGFCKASAIGIAAQLPKRKSKSPVPRVFTSAAAIVTDRQVMLIKRKSPGLLGGFWALPGSESENGELNRRELARAVREQINAEIRIGNLLGELQHEFTHRSLRMKIYAAYFSRDKESRADCQKRSIGLRWHNLDGEVHIPLSALDRKALSIVKAASR